MRGLATGRGAHVQHTGSRWQLACQIRHALCGAVLHGDIALGETRQCRGSQGFAQDQCIGHALREVRLDARIRQSLPIFVTTAAGPIDSQPQRRFVLAGIEDHLGPFRPIGPDLAAQPFRPKSVRRCLRQALALRTTQ